ncbi:MAG: nucleotidyltransferase family protein [Clostridiales bacterium]|nr:nucleotidyltransferase family protein [Clostridiales bacterium]
MENIRAYSEYLARLLACAVKNEKPPLPPAGSEIETGELYKLSRTHAVDNILYMSLDKFESVKKSGAWRAATELYKHAIVRESTQYVESQALMDRLESEGIVHMPLKGFVIKNLYPSPDMRQSTDLDIYIPDRQTKATKKVMESLGYTYDSKTVGHGMHDEYKRGKLMMVEVHRYLMAPEFKSWRKLCDRIVANKRLCSGFTYRYEMTPEDFYLYMILHTAKHLKHSSSGIKSVLDIWVYLDRYNKTLNWEYINKMLLEGELTTIERNLKTLAAHWFGNEPTDDELVLRLGDFIAENGTFGNEEQYKMWRSANTSRFSRAVDAFFLPLSEMRGFYPVLEKAPVLLPVMWLVRAFKAVFVKKSASEYIADNADRDEARKLFEFKESIGL